MSGREIRFRAYDRKLKAMFPVHLLEFGIFNNNLERIKGVDIHDKCSDHEGDVSYGGSINKMTGNPLVPRFELMEFTGKTDTAGHEVYEGDIFPDHFNRKAFGVVKLGEYINPFNDDGHGGHVGFYVEWHGDSGRNRKDLAYWLKVSRVIGNVYEHPELLGNPA